VVSIDQPSLRIQKRRRRLPHVAWIALVVALAGGIVVSVAGQRSMYTALAVPMAIAVVLLYVSRQYLAVTVIIVLSAIFLDFYQIVAPPVHEPVVWFLLASALIVTIFLMQTRERPWAHVPHLGLWVLLLIVAGLAVPRGHITATAMYYVTVFVNGLVMYIVGVQVVRNGRDLRWLLVAFSLIAAFIAAHSVVLGLTGRFLFATQKIEDYIGSRYGFHLADTTITRAGSFLQNPDWDGAYLAMMLFVPLGLATGARSRVARLCFIALSVLDALALLFTFSTAAWLAAGCALAVYVVVFVPRRYRVHAVAVIGAMAAGVAVVFSLQVRLLLAHASAQNEYTLRLGAWATALRVIAAHPLTGAGMAPTIYLVVSAPYRVPWQTVPLAYPHESYLEIAAFAGLPVFLAFLAVLVAALRTAIRSYRTAQPEVRPLLGGIIAALCALTVNSFAINGWSLPVLATIGWLLAGAAASPSLRAVQPRVLTEADWTPYLVPDTTVQNQGASSGTWADSTPIQGPRP
jgi:O-antigen ligase